jgi:hypothetical protein
MNPQPRITARIFPATLIGRLIALCIAIGLAVVGLFFVAFALVAAALTAAIVAVRVWWVLRKLRARRDLGVIEGSYSVEVDQPQTDHSARAVSDNLPPAPK